MSYWTRGVEADQQARVDVLFSKWTEILRLNAWSITIQYGDEELDESGECPSGWLAAMSCSVQWQYLVARIRVNLRACLEMDDADLENSVLHELAHVYLGEMQEIDTDGCHEERVASMLARSWGWAQNAGKPGTITHPAAMPDADVVWTAA